MAFKSLLPTAIFLLILPVNFPLTKIFCLVMSPTLQSLLTKHAMNYLNFVTILDYLPKTTLSSILRPPCCGGIQPIYGLYISESDLADDYTPKLTSMYKVITQLRNAK